MHASRRGVKSHSSVSAQHSHTQTLHNCLSTQHQDAGSQHSMACQPRAAPQPPPCTVLDASRPRCIRPTGAGTRPAAVSAAGCNALLLCADGLSSSLGCSGWHIPPSWRAGGGPGGCLGGQPRGQRMTVQQEQGHKLHSNNSTCCSNPLMYQTPTESLPLPRLGSKNKHNNETQKPASTPVGYN